MRQARAVVLAIGYYDLPNYLGVPGEDLPHVSHYYTDAHPYYRQRVVIVGGKNSAAEAALELFRAGVARDARAPARDARRLDQVLGPARHREPDQGRIDCGAIRVARRRDSTDGGGHRAAGRAGDASGRGRVPADRLSPRRRADEASGDRVPSGNAGADAQSRRRSRPTCRTCSSPAAPWRAGTPATSSSRMGAFTARGSSRSSPIGGFRRPESQPDQSSPWLIAACTMLMACTPLAQNGTRRRP